MTTAVAAAFAEALASAEANGDTLAAQALHALLNPESENEA